MLSELERKKEMLKSIRSFHEPIDYDNIRNHAKIYEQNRKEEIEKRVKERELMIKENEQNYTLGKNRSMFLEKLIQQDNDVKNEEIMKDAEKHDLHDKMKNYGKLVQQMHKPVTSRKLQVELELAKQKLKHKPRFASLAQSVSAPTKDSLASAVVSLNGTKDGNPPSPSLSMGKSEYRGYFTENRNIMPKRHWKPNDMVPKLKIKREPKKIDYLLERRIQLQDAENDDTISKTSKKPLEWSSLVDKMAQRDKVDFLLNQAKNLETKAKQKDEHNQLIDNNMKIQEESNTMLIEALKARLTALDNI